MDESSTPVVVEKPNNTLGIVSLVSGILSLIFIFCCGYLAIILGIVALVCGILAQQKQQQYALAGIILGAAGIVLGIIFTVIGYLVFPGLFSIIEREMYRW
jgi:hypothetical protein